jgi:hypothetical protein
VIAQGLLVEGPNGENFLLATEPDLAMETHRLVVMQKLNGKWEPLEGMRESVCREALIGAFVDFFVDLCRVLNSSGHEPVVDVVPMRPSSPNHSGTPEFTLGAKRWPR